MLIINADDFGLSESVNAAVVEAFRRRLVSSATIMAVTPGFEQACSLALEHDLQEHLGTHLVLTAGLPLTEKIRRCERFCTEEGVFRVRRATGPLLRLSHSERIAVAEELEAQVQLCRARGVPVTHLDSHQHVHTELGLWKVVLQVARRLGIHAIRRGRTGNLRPTARLNQRLFNYRLEHARLAATQHFGDIDDYRRLRAAGLPAHELLDLELMTHPELDEQGRLVDFHCSQAGTELGILLDGVDGVESAVSFAGRSYQPTGT